jgi:hypothetical protein
MEFRVQDLGSSVEGLGLVRTKISKSAIEDRRNYVYWFMD